MIQRRTVILQSCETSAAHVTFRATQNFALVGPYPPVPPRGGFWRSCWGLWPQKSDTLEVRCRCSCRVQPRSLLASLHPATYCSRRWTVEVFKYRSAHWEPYSLTPTMVTHACNVHWEVLIFGSGKLFFSFPSSIVLTHRSTEPGHRRLCESYRTGSPDLSVFRRWCHLSPNYRGPSLWWTALYPVGRTLWIQTPWNIIRQTNSQMEQSGAVQWGKMEDFWVVLTLQRWGSVV